MYFATPPVSIYSTTSRQECIPDYGRAVSLSLQLCGRDAVLSRNPCDRKAVRRRCQKSVHHAEYTTAGYKIDMSRIVAAIPYVLYMTGYGRVYLQQVLKLVEHKGEVVVTSVCISASKNCANVSIRPYICNPMLSAAIR